MSNDPPPLLYRQLMAIRPGNMTANQWLIAAGVSRSFFTDLKKRGRARVDIIEKVIAAAGMTPAEFYARTPPEGDVGSRRDEQRAAELPFRGLDERRDVPLLGSALGADFEVDQDGSMTFAEVTDLDMNDVVDHVRRPPVLEGRNDVYALSVVGESMSPRFDPGDPAYIDPRATPRIGDDVIVYLFKRDGDGEGHLHSVLLKRLVKRTGSYIELEQFTPAVRFTVEIKSIAKIHRVIPWREMATF